MKVIITGSKGQLGLEIINQLEKINSKFMRKKYDINSTTSSSLNITNLEDVKRIILNERPDVVINCAAHTKVDLCESDIENAYKINALGVRNLAITCEKIGAKLVQVSTDYVFNGDSSVPYREDSITCPNSIYGKSKLMGENFVKQFSSKYFIIRTAWLYGEGNNFVRTMINLAKNNNKINVINDQFGTPTSTVDLARVIINLIETEYYGIYHGTCKGQCSWYDFAYKIFDTIGLKNVILNPISSNEFKSIAQRPMYSVLDNFMLDLIGMDTFRNWEDALIEYLKK
ncbi:dTDP-4-dehydrorhamnose reductase [Clostridioides sp. ZZV14-6345]|uniref:dTDP-4-dehydrorhamnose reductase n=1 Tax=Clostridioides sp. ZZV14-6345 TaxID=2811496 RepID=UPI001D104B1B|nr:dTDP-4-dehydrorhamnose reductase [Clostridioides sp. ZZV14-6345]